jgi:hypothetical protein
VRKTPLNPILLLTEITNSRTRAREIYSPRKSRILSLACLEWSVANSVHTSARIPLTIWAIAAIGLIQTHPTLARLGLK